MKQHFVCLAAALFVTSVSIRAKADRGEQVPSASPASAGPKVGSANGPEQSTTSAGGAGPEAEKESRWSGSVLLFDQSVTTQTVGIGGDYISSDNLYEWWFAFKPRYTVFKNERTSFSVSAWTNLYLELTNSDSTTTSQEPQLGSTSVTAPLSYVLFKGGGYKTSINIGPRLVFPTDKASYASGTYLGMGATSGISQSLPLAGKGASAFKSLSFSVSGSYSYSFTRATTATNESIQQQRQDVAGRSFPSDQLRSGMLTQHRLNMSFSAAVQITERLGFGASYVLLESWAYRPKDIAICLPNTTGCIEPLRVNDPQNFRVVPWVLASLDYDANDLLSVSLGYYNQANQIGPDGQRRSPFWSPEARIFFTLTGNLEPMYRKLFGKPAQQTATAKP